MDNTREEKWLDAIRQSGYRLTKPIEAIVETVVQHDRPLSPAEVYDLARAQYPHLGRMTVYRTLEKMEDLGLIQRIHEGCHTYVPAAAESGYLLICEQCGTTEYAHDDDIARLVARIAGQRGFQAHSHLLQIFGLCAACQTA